MPAKKYIVSLEAEQRAQLTKISHSYKHSSRERSRARILLAADSRQPSNGLDDATIAQQVGVSSPTVERVRRRFVEAGVEAALYHKAQAQRKARVLDGVAEAHLIALVCGTPPEGTKRWTLHLLQDRLIAGGYAESVSHETVRQTLKKMNLSRG